MERELYSAIVSHNILLFEKLVRESTNYNVNWVHSSGGTLLHVACLFGHDSIAKHFLSNPKTNVNCVDMWGQTPLFVAFRAGMHPRIIKMLLEDPRVKVDAVDKTFQSPLGAAVVRGHLKVVKWALASGRDFDITKSLLTDSLDVVLSPLQLAKKLFPKGEMVELFEEFRNEPLTVRHRLRFELGITQERVAEVYGAMVLVADGYFVVKDGAGRRLKRFFGVAKKLPLELMMVLANRVHGSMRLGVLGVDSEKAFRDLLKS